MMSVGVWILTSHICDFHNRLFGHSYCSVMCHSMWRKCETKPTRNLTYAYDSQINRYNEFTFVNWTAFVLTLTCHCCWFLRYRAQLTDWHWVRCAHAHTHTHTHKRTRTYTRTHARARALTRAHAHTRTHAHTHAHTRARAHTHAHIRARTCAHTHTYVCVCVCVCIYIYIYIYIYGQK